MIKSRRSWGGEEECIWVIGGKVRKKETSGKKDVDGWTILKWISEGWDGMVLIRLIWLRIATSGELL
jgi:hypothetical protein